MHFWKGVTFTAKKKIQLSSPVTMGNNDLISHTLQLASGLPACMIVGEPKILKTNKSEDMIHFYLIFCRFDGVFDQNYHVLFRFSSFPVSSYSNGVELKPFFFGNPGIAKI